MKAMFCVFICIVSISCGKDESDKKEEKSEPSKIVSETTEPKKEATETVAQEAKEPVAQEPVAQEQVPIFTFEQYNARPVWFNRDESFQAMSQLLRQYENILPSMGCSQDVWTEYCEFAARSHQTMATMLKLNDTPQSWGELQWSAKIYISFTYPKFREEYAKTQHNAVTESYFTLIVRQSTVMATLFKITLP